MKSTLEKPAIRIKTIFLLCWAAYFISYLGRLNYTSVMPEMIAAGLLSKPQAGVLSTAFLIFYAVGQLINGVMSDRFSPVRMIAAGVMLTAIANAAFGLSSEYSIMLVLRCVIGFSSSMLWPSMLRLFALRMPEKQRVNYSIHMSSAVAGGALGAYLISAAMLSLFGWRAAFYAAALALAGIGIVWLCVFRGDMNSAPVRLDEDLSSEEEPVQQLPFFRMLLIPGLLFALYPVIAHGALKDGMTAWVPTFISEAFSVSPALSPVVSTVLPIVNLSGALAARFVYRRVGRNEMRASAIFFALSFGALGLMRLWGADSLVLTLGMLSVVTSSMLAINTLFVSVLPMRFSRYGRVATISGLLNAVAYGGSALASAAIGYIAEGRGWNAAIESWILLCGAAIVVCLVGQRARLGLR